MRTKRKNKIYSCFHTRSRLLQRYRIRITAKEYEQLCQKIHDNRAKLIDIEESNNQIIVDTEFRGIILRLVWNTELQYITTAIKRIGDAECLNICS